MNEDQQTPNLEESISQVMRTLPPIIRDYLSAGKYTTVARNLTTKYGLRIDQAGVLEREIMLLLMGIETPQEFAQALTEEARLDKKIVDGIAQDVNEQVFIPLRAEEQRIGMSKMPPPAVPETREEAPVPVLGTVQGSASETVPKKSAFSLENKIGGVVPGSPVRIAPHIAPLPPRTTMPARPSATLGDVVRSVLLTPAKPLESKLLLEDHEEPHIEISPVAPKDSPVEVKQSQPVALASVNLPGTLPETRIPVAFPRSEFRVPLPVKEPEDPVPSPSNRSYAVDPYREPIDEGKG